MGKQRRRQTTKNPAEGARLTQEEIANQEGANLPDREAMTIIDPAGLLTNDPVPHPPGDGPPARNLG